MTNICLIMPMYNAENHLKRSIESILSQTFSDFVLVIVDDGSNDNSVSICKQYQKKDKRIHLIKQPNCGAAKARNTGIEWAYKHNSFQWISFIDSDDWISKYYLEILYSAAVNSGASISCCGYKRVSEREDTPVGNNTYALFPAEDFFCQHVILSVVPWGKLYRKDLFDGIRYPEGIMMEDEFTTYKVIFRVKEIAYIDESLYYYYINESGVMLSMWSEKHLVGEQAYLEQIDFFKTNGYHKAFEKTLQHYCRFIVRLMQNDEVPVTIKEAYSQKLRRFMGQYHQYFDFQRDKLFYEYAYPKRMALYWKAKKVIPFI